MTVDFISLNRRSQHRLRLLVESIIINRSRKPLFHSFQELRPYDGQHEIAELGGAKAIYLAVNGTIFDVSSRAEFYGPGTAPLSSNAPVFINRFYDIFVSLVIFMQADRMLHLPAATPHAGLPQWMSRCMTSSVITEPF